MIRSMHPKFQPSATAHPDDALLDQWRAELLDREDAAQIRDHVQHCLYCRARAGFAGDVVRHLEARPQPHLRPGRSQRALPGMAPVYRLGTAMAALALVVGLSWQLNMNNDNANVNEAKLLNDPQTVKMLSDLEFYQWLAKNPQVLKKSSHEA